jgi:hypothetical protein
MVDGYGPELVTNGDFSTDLSGWTSETFDDASWVDQSAFISRGASGGGSAIYQTGATNGKLYEASFDISGITGSILVNEQETYNTNGRKTFIFEAAGGWLFIARCYASSSAYIDNVSVREMPVLKWAPHNLLTYSEDFSAADWSKTGVTITANSATSPDGSDTADLVTYTSSNDLKRVSQSISCVVGATYKQSVWVSPNGVTSIVFRNTSGDRATFSDIGLVSQSAGVSGNFLSASITSSSGGWFLLEAEFSADTASELIYIGSGSTLTGDDVSGFYIWGAHAYRSDLGGMVDNPDRGDSYVPTTSAASYLPRVGHHTFNGDEWVNRGVLAESESRTNVLLYSNDFSVATSAWSNINVTTTEKSHGPDGVFDGATRMLETATTGEHQVGDSPSFSANTDYTFSAFVKSIGGRDCTLFWFTNSANTVLQASFDLASGEVLSGPTASGSAPPSNVSADIQKFGDFYRVSISGSVGATGGSGQARIHASSGSVFNYLGDVTKGLEVYGAQLEQALTPSSYIPTAGATATRAAETFTIPSANLPWPTPEVIGPELVTNGTFDTDTSGWTANADAVVTWSSGEIVVQRVTGSIDTAIQEITTEVGKVYYISADTTDLTATGSLKIATAAGGGLNASTFESATGVNTTLSVIFIAQTTTTYIALGGNAGGTISSYDNISVREINPLSVSLAMKGAMTYADEGVVEGYFYFWNKDASNTIYARLSSVSSRTGEVNFRQYENGVLGATVSATDYLTPGILVPYNISSRHGSTFINGAVDGVALTADTTPTALPDLSSTDLSLAYDYMGTIESFRVWNQDLGDDGLETATAPSTEPTLNLTFDGSGLSFTDKGWTP